MMRSLFTLFKLLKFAAKDGEVNMVKLYIIACVNTD